MNNSEMKVFSGTVSRPMTEQICAALGMTLGKALVSRFADGEVKVAIEESVRAAHLFIVNSTQPPLENLMEMLLLSDAAIRASAASITLVFPYLGYNRQDRKDRPRVPISAEMFAELIACSGANRVLLFELHSETTAGFFPKEKIKVDHLYGSYVTVPYLRDHLDLSNLVVASTDKGGVAMARAYARLLGIKKVVVFDKKRKEDGTVDEDSIIIIGEVAGHNVLFVDDTVDTAGTLVADTKAAKEAGAKDIDAVVTHPVLSGNAVERLQQSPIRKLVVTDSFFHPSERLAPLANKLTVLPCAPMFWEAIRRIHNGESLSFMIL